jgi:hypothetical protein
VGDRLDDIESNEAVLGKIAPRQINLDIRNEGGDLVARGRNAHAKGPRQRRPEPRIARADPAEHAAVHEIYYFFRKHSGSTAPQPCREIMQHASAKDNGAKNRAVFRCRRGIRSGTELACEE